MHISISHHAREGQFLQLFLHSVVLPQLIDCVHTTLANIIVEDDLRLQYDMRLVGSTIVLHRDHHRPDDGCSASVQAPCHTTPNTPASCCSPLLSSSHSWSVPPILVARYLLALTATDQLQHRCRC